MNAAPSPLPISVVTDYGGTDEFAGILRLVLSRAAPGAPVVELTHEIPAHDVRAGALLLWRTVPWLAPGVVLAVVDPGVATGRRAVALATPAAGGLVLVGPDNGLLLPAALAAGGVERAVELTGSGPPGAGATFAGRDVFAPAAAALARGVAIETLGAPVDPATLRGRAVDEPVPTSEGLTCEVLWVDRYGNAQLNARPADVDGIGAEVAATVTSPAPGASRTWPLARVAAYADIPAGAWGLVTDSYGLCAICGDRRPAAELLGLRAGDPVLLRPRPTWY